MQRPENFGLLMLLIIGGGILMLAIGAACHVLARRIIDRRNYLVFKIAGPFLLLVLVIVFYVFVPGIIGSFYQTYYGYQVLPDEAPGPLGDNGSGDLLLAAPLLLFGLMLLIGYAVFLALRAIVRPRQPPL